MQPGVIFDMDGVLVLTADAHWKAWRAVAAARGIDLQYATFLSCFGRVNADCIRVMIGPVDDREAERIAIDKEDRFRRLMAQEVPLAPGLTRLLNQLVDRGAKLAVGTSAPRENLDLVLDRAAIRPFFAACIDGSQVTRGKPDPDVFLQAAKKLGLAPAACAVIEDAPAGISAARAADMLAVGVATTHTDRQLVQAGAQLSFPDIECVNVDTLLASLRSRFEG